MDEIWEGLFNKDKPLSGEAQEVMATLLLNSGFSFECEHGKNKLNVAKGLASMERMPALPKKKILVKKPGAKPKDLPPPPQPVQKPDPLPPKPKEPVPLPPLPKKIAKPEVPKELKESKPKPDIEDVLAL